MTKDIERKAIKYMIEEHGIWYRGYVVFDTEGYITTYNVKTPSFEATKNALDSYIKDTIL